jgi:hypothetical protein
MKLIPANLAKTITTSAKQIPSTSNKHNTTSTKATIHSKKQLHSRATTTPRQLHPGGSSSSSKVMPHTIARNLPKQAHTFTN